MAALSPGRTGYEYSVGRGDVPILFRPHLGTLRGQRQHRLPGGSHDGRSAASPDACARRGARARTRHGNARRIIPSQREIRTRSPTGRNCGARSPVLRARSRLRPGYGLKSPRGRGSRIHAPPPPTRRRSQAIGFFPMPMMARRAISTMFVAGNPVHGMSRTRSLADRFCLQVTVGRNSRAKEALPRRCCCSTIAPMEFRRPVPRWSP